VPDLTGAEHVRVCRPTLLLLALLLLLLPAAPHLQLGCCLQVLLRPLLQQMRAQPPACYEWRAGPCPILQAQRGLLLCWLLLLLPAAAVWAVSAFFAAFFCGCW
jgi:hypothetical protein